MPFMEQKVLIVMKSILLILSFAYHVFDVAFKVWLSNPKSSRFSPMAPSRSFSLCFTFRSVIHLWFIFFVKSVKSMSRLFIYYLDAMGIWYYWGFKMLIWGLILPIVCNLNLRARLLCSWNSPGKNTGEGCHSLLQRIFPTQGLNLNLLHWRWILYHLSHRGSLKMYVWSMVSPHLHCKQLARPGAVWKT